MEKEIVTLEEFIKENEQYIHALTREDIGSTVIKVIGYRYPGGITDFSYMETQFVVEDKHECIRNCDICPTEAVFCCKKCKNTYYCSEYCQNRVLDIHSYDCDEYAKEEYQQEIVLIPVDKKYLSVYTSSLRLKENFLLGWIDVKHVKDLDKLTQMREDYRKRVIRSDTVILREMFAFRHSPSAVAYDNLSKFVKENEQYIHTLTKEDIDTTVVKVVAYVHPTGAMDLHYMDGLYVVKDYSKETKVCDFILCENDADRRCKKCYKRYYCSEECLKEDSDFHSDLCEGNDSRDSRLVLVPLNEEDSLFFKNDRSLGKIYTTGWMNIDKVKDIDLLLQLISEYKSEVTSKYRFIV